MATPRYYRPYLASDSELSDSDSEASFSSTPSSPQRPPNAGPDLSSDDEETANFAALARALQAPASSIVNASGPTFASVEQEIAYGTNQITDKITYSTAEFKDASGVKIKFEIKDTSTVVVLQSRDRDKTVFLQPTDCQLFLPRIYKNIIGFSVSQINLTSAFFYFRPDKENLQIQIQEKDNILYTPVTSNPVPQTNPDGSIKNLTIVRSIRPGSYSIDELLTEIQLQLNRTPVFYDFINGFDDFKNIFKVQGDFSLNFNYPGDNYYDPLTKTFVNNPTRQSITSNYFQTQFANLLVYTEDQILIAYYYPVLKETVLDPDTNLSEYSLSYGSLSQEEVVNYIIYNFTGLNDTIIITLIKQGNNRTLLDNYRLLHTFRYSLVNRYLCSYDKRNNRVTIKSTTLNTSLVNLLTSQYNIFFAQQLASYNLTLQQYQFQLNNITNIIAILQSMYDYLQRAFNTFFAVPINQYSIDYYTNSNWTVLIRDGLNSLPVGIASNTYSNDILQFNKQKPKNYWTGLKGISSIVGGSMEGPPRNMGDTISEFPASSNYPYNVSFSNIDFSSRFIDSNGLVHTDTRSRAGDVITDVKSTRYTIFQFKSKYRQTLQIETLPRQTTFRYPEWNKAQPLRFPISTLFDASYSFIEPSPQLLSSIAYTVPVTPIPGWSNVKGTSSNYQIDSFSNSRSYWGTTFQTITAADQNGFYYSFQTPQPSTLLGPSRYQFNLSICSPDSNPIQADLLAFIYHDVGAFYADISGARNNNPLNYKYSFQISSTTLSNTLTFPSYINQSYYLIVRSVNPTFNKTDFIIVPHFSNIQLEVLSTNTNFSTPTYEQPLLNNWHVAQVNDPAFIRLPIQSTLWEGQSPAIDISSIQTQPLIPPFIGYDYSNVSNDLTDYIPYQALATSTIFPLALTRADPVNNYLFQYNTNSPYTIGAQSYFYPGSQNSIYTSNLLQSYTWDSNGLARSTLSRQYKMVQYYGTNYLSLPTSSNLNVTSNDISPFIPPYSIETTSNSPIQGYEYSDSNLMLGFGTCGIMFLPPDGIWEMERFTFKTNFITNTPGNINDEIQLLGVFLSSEVYDEPLNEINLSNAVAILMPLTKTMYTSTMQNFGFDAGYGTYYTFSNTPDLLTNKKLNFQLTGYSQRSKELIDDPNSYYSILPFTGFNSNDISTKNISSLIQSFGISRITCFHNLVGSPIAYPYANQAYPSPNFYDGTPPPVAGKGLVLSTSNANAIYGPPSGYDESVVQYEQSIPYVNSHLHYQNYFNIINSPEGFSAWSNVPGVPTRINAAVPDYILIQDGSFTLTKYTYFSSLAGISSSQRSFTNYAQTPLTIDQIFPNNEQTEFLAFSGNSNGFIFLGASNTYLRFKQYDPRNGTLVELPRNSNYRLQTTSNLVQQFVYHDTTRWALTSYHPSLSTVTLYGDLSYSSNSNTIFSRTFNQSRWSELQMDPGGLYLYFARSYTPTPEYSNITLFGFNFSDSTGYLPTGPGYTINLQGPQLYKQFMVTVNNGNDEILLLSDISANSFFKIESYLTTSINSISNTNIKPSVQLFSNAPRNLFGGARGSKWMIFESASNSFIYGNRNDSFDSPVINSISWQIFFPTMKVQMNRIGISSNPIPDLTNIDYPEWPHSQMFAYSNYQTLSNDIFAEGGKWGLESNFLVSDVDFRGYYFNSYIINVPLLSNYGSNNSNNDYFIAIRGYSPTEQFQTMTRFYLPNRYDFGFVRFTDIINEAPLASNTPLEFTNEYLIAIRGFNSTFTFSNQNFGIQGYTGSNYSSSNFGEFMSIYRSTFLSYQATSNIIAGIQTNLQSSINGFIANDLKYILPSTATTRQRYTDSLLFKIMWNTNLSSNFRKLDDEWGLGWNLGFSKRDTGFSTIHVGDSFYKIQQDFIYLRLNQEFNINRMDAGGKENYRAGRESTGTTNQYYCKLLLTNFGGNSTTFIHNPITFNPPLNRLTRLSFQWVYPDGSIIDNNDAEWNMTVNIIERLELPVLPDKMIFQPADPKTGKPAPLPSGFAGPVLQKESNLQMEREKKNLEEEQRILREEAKLRKQVQSGGAVKRK